MALPNVEELANEVFKAWNYPGKNPRYHRQKQRELQDEWPVLYNRLRRLEEGVIRERERNILHHTKATEV